MSMPAFRPGGHFVASLTAGLVVVACTARTAPAAAPGAETPPSVDVVGAKRAAVSAPSQKQPLTPAWTFGLGSTIHGPPAVGEDGVAYVGTGDGRLVAVSADGVMRWSFTVEGSIAAGPVLSPEGHVLVATLASRLYAFSPRGVLSWETRVPATATTQLVVSPAFGVLFGAADGSLWAYSFHATALFHVPLAGDMRTSPRPLGQKTWVGVGDDLVLVDGASRRARVRLDGTVEHLAEPLPSGAAVVIAGGDLSVVTPRGEVTFRRSRVAWAETVGTEIVLVEPRGRVIRVSADGVERATAESGVRPTEPPLTLPSGLICVPGEAGNLALVDPGGGVTRVAVAQSALHSPVHDAPRKRLVVASGDGTLASLPVGE